MAAATKSVLIAVFLAALMATGMPASAFNTASSVNLATDSELEVASQHTTDTDFQNAKTLDDLTIDGTGSSASVVLDTAVDNFEDGDVAEWSGAMELNQTPNTGTYNGLVNASGDASSQTGSLGLANTDSVVFSTAIRTSNFDAYGTVRYRSGGTKIIEFGFDTSGNLYYVDGSGTAQTIQAANADTYYTVAIRNLDYAADTYDIYVDGSEAVTGVSFINAADSIDEIQPYAGAANGGTTTLVDDIEDDVNQGRYVGGNHTVDNAQQAWQNVALTNATANATLEGWDGSQWVDVKQVGISSTANQTVSLSGSYSKYRWDSQLTELNHKAISRWSANEGSGTTVTDKVDGNDGEFNETDWSSSSKTGGQSVYFNSDNNDLLASDDYVSFKGTTQANHSAFGWSGWVRPEVNDTHAAILDNWNGSDGIRVHHQTDGSVVFNVTTKDGSNQKIQGGNLETGAFHLVTVGRTVNGQMFIRVNKTTVASTPATSSPISESDAFVVWGINSNDKDTLTFKGWIDEAGLWGRALTQEETALLYDNPAAFNESTAKIHDEGIQFQNDFPGVDNSSASPNSTTKHYSNVTLSVDVSDKQFASSQGEELTVEFTHDGSVVDTQTVTANGTVETSLSNVGDGSHSWSAEVTDSYGDVTTSKTFSYDITHFTPNVNNSSADPQGGETTSSDPVTLSVDVNDSDFAFEGDSLTVTFYQNDGTKIGTDTLASNGTATADWNNVEGGTNKWYAVASDDYAATADTTSDTFAFKSPSAIYVRQETNATELVNESVTVTVVFYGEDQTIERTTTDGTIDMTGIPVGKEFVAVAEADGWHNRRIVIQSLTQQQNIFLLNKSVAEVNNTIKLDDQTGQYPSSSTRLRVQASLNLSNDSSPHWYTISGDYFGASEEFPVTLEEGGRYRFVIDHDTSGRRELGSYIARDPGVVELSIGEVTFPVGKDTTQYNWRGNFTNKSGTESVKFSYADPADATTDFHLEIYSEGNKSNPVYTTDKNTLGNLSTTYLLSENESELTWYISWSATRNGESIGATRIVGKSRHPVNWTLDPMLEKLFVGLLLIFIAAMFPGRASRSGAVVVAASGMALWSMGWLDIPIEMVMTAAGVAVVAKMAEAGVLER